MYITTTNSSIGVLTLISDGRYLIKLFIKNQKYSQTDNHELIKDDNLDIFIKTKQWLKNYFEGKKVNPKELNLLVEGTIFQKTVWDNLLNIPYGTTTTYKELGNEVAKQLGKKTMSAQAIGGAVGRNPIAIIIPCHRVIGTNGSLTGYAAGIKNKASLLELEQGGKKFYDR